MSWLAQVMAASHPATPEKWLVEWFTGPTSGTGLHVSIDTAKRLTAVTAALRIISETQAMVPLLLYRRLKPRGKDRASDHPLYRVLHNQPNPWQTAFEFKRMMTWHAAASGAAYARIVTGNDGTVQALIPLLPGRVRPMVAEDGRIFYQYRGATGQPTNYRFEDVFKLLAFSEDGVTSKSLIETCQEAVGVGMAAEEFAARFYGNNGTPNGVLTHPKALRPDAKDRLRNEWAKRYEGPQNFGKTALLEEGMKYEAIGVPFKDAQFLESRKFQVTEIARLFRIPPHLLADLERSTNNNIEHQGLEFVTYTMSMWLVLWEQSIWRDLLTESEQADLFAEHLVDALLRGDTASRYSAYNVGRNGGWLSANDVRERENMNPIEDGDEYLKPMNMVPAGEERPAPAPRPAQPPVPPPLKRAALVGLLEDPWRRVVRRTTDQLAKIKAPHGPAPVDRQAALTGLCEYILATVTPTAQHVADLSGGTSDVRPIVAVLAVDYVEAVVRSGSQLASEWADRTLGAIERWLATTEIARGKAA